MEEFAFVLDHLPEGRPTVQMKRYVEPLSYVVGRDELKLFEITLKAPVEIGERVYVGRNPAKRNKVNKILRRISYPDLTSSAKSELPEVLENVVMEREDFFVEFFNKASPITTRFHMLELIPGFGKKMMWTVIKERDRSKFKSFSDLSERTGIKNPQKLTAKRIEDELSSKNERYLLFVKG